MSHKLREHIFFIYINDFARKDAYSLDFVNSNIIFESFTLEPATKNSESARFKGFSQSDYIL